MKSNNKKSRKEDQVDKITCAERPLEEEENVRSKTVFDCSVHFKSGDHELKDNIYELDVKGDMEITDNPNVGERHITPQESVEINEVRGQLKITSTDRILQGRN